MFCGIIRIGDEALIAIGQGCHQLRLLNVSGCHRVGDVGLTSIAQGCPNLIHLDVSVCQVCSGEPNLLSSERMPSQFQIFSCGVRCGLTPCTR